MAFTITKCSGLAGPGAKFPQWTVIASSLEGGTTGVVGKVDNAINKSIVETTAWPSKVYFFTSQQAAQNCINQSGGAVSPPLQKIASAGQSATNAATDVLGKFNLGTWFLRIGEILLGLVLVGVGIARITGAQNFISQAVKSKVPIPV